MGWGALIIGLGFLAQLVGVFVTIGANDSQTNTHQEEKIISQSCHWESTYRAVPDERTGNLKMEKSAFIIVWTETNKVKKTEKIVPYIDENGKPDLKLDAIEWYEVKQRD